MNSLRLNRISGTIYEHIVLYEFCYSLIIPSLGFIIYIMIINILRFKFDFLIIAIITFFGFIVLFFGRSIIYSFILKVKLKYSILYIDDQMNIYIDRVRIDRGIIKGTKFDNCRIGMIEAKYIVIFINDGESEGVVNVLDKLTINFWEKSQLRKMLKNKE